MAVWLIAVCVTLYGVFLWIQTLRHRGCFRQPTPKECAEEVLGDDHAHFTARSVAILVLTPESLAAVKAALGNRLQRTMNISLRSALSTIGLTIPAVLGISLATGLTVELGFEEPEVYLLVLTLLVSVVNLSSDRTNVLHGVVHIVLFFTYGILIFD